MKIFLTGGTGFIGSALVPQLIQRGDTVVCLVRDPGKAALLTRAGAQLAPGDITNRDIVRTAMRGADAVIHLAGMYEFGRKYLATMRRVNVDGARIVLETAAELGVPRIFHTSTVGVFGNTHGKIVGENYRIDKKELPSEYERTKWEAHYEVAVPLQKQGAPLIITQPGGVTGIDDTSPHATLYDYFLNRTPIMFGANSGLTWAHVDDIAGGHILALERGTPGEAYVLAGPSLTYREVFDLWSKLTGIPSSKLWVPSWVVGAMQPVVAALERSGLPLPVASEAMASLKDYTFFASSVKAKRELGWQLRAVEDLFRQVLNDRIRKRRNGFN